MERYHRYAPISRLQRRAVAEAAETIRKGLAVPCPIAIGDHQRYSRFSKIEADELELETIPFQPQDVLDNLSTLIGSGYERLLIYESRSRGSRCVDRRSVAFGPGIDQSGQIMRLNLPSREILSHLLERKGGRLTGLCCARQRIV